MLMVYDLFLLVVFFFKQKTAYEMRISDWSSDVCSSDLTAEDARVVVEFEGNAVTCEGKPYCNQYCMVFTMRDGRIGQVNEYFCTILADEIGRASCRESVGQ